ncbi:hypothetical protein B0H11DRAFT_1791322 [Mycena galericulata]|nr:hypothetical protein B0H11DRAFT_1791322 [Mycena galericulata]
MFEDFRYVFSNLRYLFFTFIPDQLFSKLPEIQANLTGRNFIVTGSNTGLGLALAVHLARRNPAKLILAVRDVQKGDAAKVDIIAQTGCDAGVIEVWELDMAEFDSVKRFAAHANSTLKRLDGAVLNAGINAWKWGTTSDGWERIFKINVLSTGLLGLLLLPLLQATTRLGPPHPDASQLLPHLTITGSAALFMAKFPHKSAPNVLRALNDEAQCDILDQYPTSKLFNLFLARKIATLPKAGGLVVNVVDPGLCISDLGRDLNISSAIMYFVNLLAWTTAKGALNLLYAVLTPTPPGAYITSCEVRPPSSWSQSSDGIRVQEQVWDELLQVWGPVSPEVAGIVG